VVADLVSGIAAPEVSLQKSRLKLDCAVEVGERGGVAGPVGVQAPASDVGPGEVRREFQCGIVVGKRLLVVPAIVQKPPSLAQQCRLLGRRARPGLERLGDLQDRRRLGAASLGRASERTRRPQHGTGKRDDDRGVSATSHLALHAPI
jgi:hypothetical protein